MLEVGLRMAASRSFFALPMLGFPSRLAPWRYIWSDTQTYRTCQRQSQPEDPFQSDSERQALLTEMTAWSPLLAAVLNGRWMGGWMEAT